MLNSKPFMSISIVITALLIFMTSAFNSVVVAGYNELQPPVLSKIISGSQITLAWSAVSGGTGYKIIYAPYPNVDYIKQVDMGNTTSITFNAQGFAFYVAVQAYNSINVSQFSNIESFDLSEYNPEISDSCEGEILPSPSYDEAFPRIGVMFGSSVLNGKKNLLEYRTIEDLAKYDLIVSQNLVSSLGTKACELKKSNPDIELLKTSQGVMVNLNGYNNCDSNNDNIFKQQGFDEAYLLHYTNGDIIKWWDNDVGFFNFCSEKAVNWLIDYVSSCYENSDVAKYYTGFFFDGLHYDFWNWMQNIIFIENNQYKTVQVDCNGDGVADSESEFSKAWKSGIKTFLSEIKKQYPNLKILANDAYNSLDEYKPYLNGSIFEKQALYWLDRFPNLWFDPWADIIELGNSWTEQSLQPPLSFLLLGGKESLYSEDVYRYDPWNDPNWEKHIEQVKADKKRMRFGLGVACLSSLTFSYDFGSNAWGSTYFWYPEYDGNGRGVHYLGKAAAPPEKILLGNCMNMLSNSDFETGTVQPWKIQDNVPQNSINGAFGITSSGAYEGSNCIWVAADSAVSYKYDDWVVQIYHPYLSFKKGVEYTISFAARSEKTRTASFQVHLNEDPWKSYSIPYTEFTTSPEWKQYTYTFNAQEEIRNGKGRFNFYIARNTSKLFLDNIVISESCSTVYKRDFEKGRVYVNPNQSTKTVVLEKTFYNLYGQPVNSIELNAFDAAFLLSNPD